MKKMKKYSMEDKKKIVDVIDPEMIKGEVVKLMNTSNRKKW